VATRLSYARRWARGAANLTGLNLVRDVLLGVLFSAMDRVVDLASGGFARQKQTASTISSSW
jgi:hypothetical protein